MERRISDLGRHPLSRRTPGESVHDVQRSVHAGSQILRCHDRAVIQVADTANPVDLWVALRSEVERSRVRRRVVAVQQPAVRDDDRANAYSKDRRLWGRVRP